MRRGVEQQLSIAVGAAMAGDHPVVWREVRAVVDADPLASAPTAIAANRLCALLLDGVPVSALRPDARLEPVVDVLALHTTSGALLADNPAVPEALRVIGALLTAAAVDPVATHVITDRLRRGPDLARYVLYLMVVACAQRLTAAAARGEHARQAYAARREDSRGT